MDVIAAYQQVGTYRGAAAMCGTTHKTVKRILELQERGETRAQPPRARNDGRARPDRPARAARAKTTAERQLLALGPVAQRFLTGAAAAGVAKLPGEIDAILTLRAAHGEQALTAALDRAVQFGRWRADDVRSILAVGGAAPDPRPAGQALVLTLPRVPTRSLDAYRVDRGGEGA